ncbi:MAG: hypothetical protein ABR553_02460 [Gammaproteobacteria bacterium]
MKNHDKSRRAFVKKLLYTPPAIATLTVLPAFQASGSGWNEQQTESDSTSTDTSTSGSNSFSAWWSRIWGL